MKVNETEYTIKNITAGIRAEYQEIISEGATIDQRGELSMSVKWTYKGKIFLVSACTGMTIDEVKELDIDTFDKLMDAIEKTAVYEKKK